MASPVPWFLAPRAVSDVEESFALASGEGVQDGSAGGGSTRLVSAYRLVSFFIRLAPSICHHQHRPAARPVLISAGTDSSEFSGQRGGRAEKMATSSGNAVFVLLLSACCLATLACDPNGAKFGYVGSMGPDHWGSLNPNFTRCATGTNQSPIDIATDEAVFDPSMKALHRNYTVANASIVDNVFNIGLRMEGGDAPGCVNVDGKHYRLKQIHWHSPSEHTFNGQRFPLELHMVHTSDDGNVTVVAILYRIGRPDPFFWQIQDKLARLYAEGCDAEKGVPLPAGFVNMLSLRRHAYMYYRYVGSFTTPPCTENVVWNILAQVREMTLDQAAALMAPLEEEYRHNNRPTQPTNGRTVRLYHRFWKKNKRSP
ncbi:hypothetical protein PR202_ga20421 [Eleusine coracana subsp. coracana]|uniref:Alpha-carbonic anhydrase domain-containing protein n=1 Tax=Eleusine coracana subsp. coracana TaxID=191504 RepID=A0AAV5CYQ7_ELECO|nr:hypothetical protein PR202_ga20421 [Eleusine coracana subsp. coracana]